MLVRRETASDLEAIDAVHGAAFEPPADGGEPVEVRLVRDLRHDTGWVPALSLVAEEATGAVVGHVVCTVGSLGGGAALGPGPIGVLPPHQRRGVGGALMHAVLGAADALDFPVVVLVGHGGYYSRFGFVTAGTIGVLPPDPSWEAHFQARTLSAWSPELSGVFRYAAPFETLA